MMRLDHWLPRPTATATEKHRTLIQAPAATVYRALWTADYGGRIARALLAVRLIPVLLSDLPHAVARVRRYRAEDSRLTLHTFLRSGFAELEVVPDQELVLGLTGRFWTPSGGLTPTTATTFTAGPPLGQAQVAWNFYIESLETGATVLSTETRVRVAQGTARTQFLIYWSMVRPFSGLLRRLMLRAVRREVERVSRASA